MTSRRNTKAEHLKVAEEPTQCWSLMAVEEEYDAFFADLSKQISLLIMDDEEELHVQFPDQLPRQIIVPPYYGFEAACRRESRGTGVFIPRVTVPRRKNKSRKPTQADIGQQRDSKTAPAISHGVATDNRVFTHAV